MLTTVWVFAVTFGALLLGACSRSMDSEAVTPASPGLANERSMSTLLDIPATTEIHTGVQRVSFLLVSDASMVTKPEVTVNPIYHGDAVGEVNDPSKQTMQARFFLWPYGVRGSYSTELNFDQTGPWSLDVAVAENGTVHHTQIPLEVIEPQAVVRVGEKAPIEKNKTIGDVAVIGQLSSAPEPDQELYVLSIPEAIKSRMPTVIVFATPAFCTSPTCGPQVEVLSTLKEQYRAYANFIHVELYDNPHEIQGDLRQASPLIYRRRRNCTLTRCNSPKACPVSTCKPPR